MRYKKLVGLAMLLGMMSMAAAQPAAEKIAARPIKYEDLGKLVRSQRGKVVVVDCWSLG
jgi:Skp family chaperone for outer membrane proteins